MAEVKGSAEAKRDLKAITEHFDISSTHYSKYLVERIYTSVSELKNFPK